MFKFLLPLIFILIDWYFFSGVQTVIKDFSPQRKVTIQTVYWVISAITILGLIVTGAFSQASLPGFFRGYLVSVIFIIFVSKLLACTFLLVDDILRLFRLGYQYATTINHPEQREGISRLKFLSYVSGGFLPLLFYLFFMDWQRAHTTIEFTRLRLNLKIYPKLLVD